MHLRGRNRERRSMAPALRRRLLDAFREDTLALADFLDRDLSAWRDPEAPRQAPDPGAPPPDGGGDQISSEARRAPREAMK